MKIEPYDCNKFEYMICHTIAGHKTFIFFIIMLIIEAKIYYIYIANDH